MSRFTAATGLVLLVTTALVGCTPAAEPELPIVTGEPSATHSWSASEAFAEAEKTFRAYWSLDAFDEDEAADLQYVTGGMRDYYESDRERPYEGRKVEVRGEALISWFKADQFESDGDVTSVVAGACIDATDLQVNVDGEGWEHPRDDPIYGIELRFESVGNSMLIENMTEVSPNPCL